MSRAIRRVAMVVSFAAAAGYIAYQVWLRTPADQVDVYDGFEAKELSALWDTDRFEPGAVTMQSDVVRSGHGAAKVVVRSRDKFEAGVQGDKDSERAELREPDRLIAKEDRTYEQAFSMLIPTDFPIVPVRLVIAQWKQDCNGHANCDNDSPVVALRYTAGVLQITHQIARARKRDVLFESAEELRGKWTDFRFRVRFTTQENGLVQGWINGKQVVDFHGANAYPEDAESGYAKPSRFYFKMGLYRDVMPEPMTVYLDEYRKRQLIDGK